MELSGHLADAFELSEIDAEIEIDGLVQLPGIRTAPDPHAVEAAVRFLRAAERPILVVGGGVRSSGAVEVVRAFAEHAGIPVASSMTGKDVLPASHPLNVGVTGLYARQSANDVVLDADVVFMVGTRAGSQATVNWKVPSKTARVIHLDIDVDTVGRHYPDAVKILSDVKLGVEAVAAELAKVDVPDWASWREHVAAESAKWYSGQSSVMSAGQEPLRPEWLNSELSQLLPDNSMVVADTGHSGMWTAGYLDLLRDGQRFVRAAGTLGWGLPASIGAQLATPDSQVVLFTGDGGLWYHLSELETARRWNVPITIVLNNNKSLNQEIDIYARAYGGELHGRHQELWHFHDVDFGALAESIGVHAAPRVTRASQFASSLEEAMSHNGPSIVEVQTDIEALAPKGSGIRGGQSDGPVLPNWAS